MTCYYESLFSFFSWSGNARGYINCIHLGIVIYPLKRRLLLLATRIWSGYVCSLLFSENQTAMGQFFPPQAFIFTGICYFFNLYPHNVHFTLTIT